jgi:hypothetical protein
MPTALFTPLMSAHAIAAGLALPLGAVILLRRKGELGHRWMGRTWFALMTFVAAGSFGIRVSGHYSWIHGLSTFTLVMLALGLYMARTGRIESHKRIVQGLYFGALIIAGLFTLLPNRLLGHWLWTQVLA